MGGTSTDIYPSMDRWVEQVLTSIHLWIDGWNKY